MDRFIAFLRAINVGGHVVKMQRLRAIFEDLGFDAVETFIASGNVIFSTRKKEAASLQKLIERKLHAELGYEVITFVRSETELQRIALFDPFSQSKRRTPESTLFIAFLSAEPAADAARRLTTYDGATDEFQVEGQELYWLCHTRMSDSAFSGAKLEKTLGMRTTVRNANTVRRLAAKLSSSVGPS